MKRITFILFAIVILLSGCQGELKAEFPQSISPEEKNEILDPSGSYRHTLFDGIYIEVNTETNYELFNSKGNLQLSGFFYKYAFNNEGFVAICNLSNVQNYTKSYNKYFYVNNSKYGYDKLEIYLFDSELNIIGEYESYSSFAQYCKENRISFEHWYYRGSGYSNRIKLTPDVYIEKTSERGMTLFVNDEPDLVGCISEYAVIDNNTVAVCFQERQYDYMLYDTDMKINDDLNREEFGQNGSIKDPHSFNPFKKVKLYEAVIVYDVIESEIKRVEYVKKDEMEKLLEIACEWIRV